MSCSVAITKPTLFSALQRILGRSLWPLQSSLQEMKQQSSSSYTLLKDLTLGRDAENPRPKQEKVREEKGCKECIDNMLQTG